MPNIIMNSTAIGSNEVADPTGSALKNRVVRLLVKYRDLKMEDLDLRNPEYSCIICGNVNCQFIGKVKSSCAKHVDIAPDAWARRNYSLKR